MEKAFSILMFIMGGCLLLYAGLLALSGDVKMIPRHYSSKIKNPHEYCKGFALIIMLVAADFLLTGLVGLTQIYWLAMIVLVGGFVGCMFAAARIIKIYN